MDQLLVSITGNLFFEGAQVFCGRTYVKTTSIGNRITVGNYPDITLHHKHPINPFLYFMRAVNDPGFISITPG